MNFLAIAKYSLVALGAAILAGAAALAANTRGFVAAAQRAEGTVVDVLPNRSDGRAVSYSPVVEFRTPDGRLVEVRAALSARTPAYAEGDKVPVLYPPADPQQARIATHATLWGAATRTAGLGAALLLTGAGLIAWPLRRERRARRLMAHGTPLLAEVREVAPTGRTGWPGRRTWRIVAQWKDPVTADFHVFRSATLRADPSRHLSGPFVTVFIDGQNPRRYHLDTSFIPPQAR